MCFTSITSLRPQRYWWGRYYYYLHFTDKKTDALKNLFISVHSVHTQNLTCHKHSRNTWEKKRNTWMSYNFLLLNSQRWRNKDRRMSFIFWNTQYNQTITKAQKAQSILPSMCFRRREGMRSQVVPEGEVFLRSSDLIRRTSVSPLLGICALHGEWREAGRGEVQDSSHATFRRSHPQKTKASS